MSDDPFRPTSSTEEPADDWECEYDDDDGCCDVCGEPLDPDGACEWCEDF